MPASHRSLAIDVGGTAVKLAVVWDDGRVEATTEIPTHADAGPEAGAARILDAGRDLMEAVELAPAEMHALGIASAGIVDRDRNLVLDAPNLRRWENYPLAANLGTAFGVPAFLENDASAMTYGEWRCGAGRDRRHLLCLTLGTGVGGGLIIDGQPYRGARGAGGEIGHITLDRNGPACPCGSSGCLERYVGAPAIAVRAAELLGRDSRPSALRSRAERELTPRVIREAATAGDTLAIEVLAATGAWLGVGLASLANVLDMERIVVGGGVAKAGDLILEPARRVLRERAMSVPGARVEIVAAALGNQAAVVGVALLALERVQGS